MGTPSIYDLQITIYDFMPLSRYLVVGVEREAQIVNNKS